MSEEMTPEQRAEIALDRILNGVGMKYAISDQISLAIEAERERCANIVEDHRHPKVHPCNGIFCDELLAAAIRAEPEEEDAD